MDNNPHPPSQQTPFAGDENQHQPMAGIQNAIIGNTTNPGPSPGTHFPTSGSAPQNPNPFPIYMATGHPGQSHPAQGSYPSSNMYAQYQYPPGTYMQYPTGAAPVPIPGAPAPNYQPYPEHNPWVFCYEHIFLIFLFIFFSFNILFLHKEARCYDSNLSINAYLIFVRYYPIPLSWVTSIVFTFHFHICDHNH